MIVEVAYALPERQQILSVALESGATVADALSAAALGGLFDDTDVSRMAVGIFGEVVDRSQRLRDGDRVEVYRPLLVDPKQARKQKAKTTSRR